VALQPTIAAAVVALAVFGASLEAQETVIRPGVPLPQEPELTEVQALTRTVLLKDVELLQYRYQEFLRAQAELNARVQAFQAEVLAMQPDGTEYDALTGLLTRPEPAPTEGTQ
jgi:hypothetical protein